MAVPIFQWWDCCSALRDFPQRRRRAIALQALVEPVWGMSVVSWSLVLLVTAPITASFTFLQIYSDYSRALVRGWSSLENARSAVFWAVVFYVLVYYAAFIILRNAGIAKTLQRHRAYLCKCGYSVRGLPVVMGLQRCPECGEPFVVVPQDRESTGSAR